MFRRNVEDSAYYPDRNMPSRSSLWSNYQLIQYLNEAQKEFAERTLIFKDSQSFAPDITADDPWIDLDSRILRIERAELASKDQILPVLTIEQFQTQYTSIDYGYRRTTSWATRTGTPQVLLRDIELNKLRAYPIPTEDDVLELTVRRLPMSDLTDIDDSLEVPQRYQFGLLHGLEAYALASPLFPVPDIAMSARVRWEEFLNKSDSTVKIRTRGPGTVRYGGF
jgi:hypothetical protein